MEGKRHFVAQVDNSIFSKMLFTDFQAGIIVNKPLPMRCVIEFVHTIVLTKHFDWQVKIADKLKKLLNDYFRAERKFREDL